MAIKRHPKDRGYGYKKSYNYEQSIAEHEDLEPTKEDWAKLRERMPSLICDSLIFGFGAGTFLLIIASIIIGVFKLLNTL